MLTVQGWTCFHCAEYFAPTVEGRAAAREHFGPAHAWTPACVEQRCTTTRDALQASRQARIEADTLRVECERLGDTVAALRAKLRDADAFSRAVHRMRPNCWNVAMIDVHGAGIYHLPREPKPE